MFNGFLEQQRQQTDAVLRRISARLSSGGSVVAQAMAYALASDGKRLRPALCVATYQSIARRAAPPGVYELAAAIEILHTYSLVHDDLPCMDDDDFRRGRPTTHRLYGEAAAVLAGAALIPLAFELVAGACKALALDAAHRKDIVAGLAQAAGCSGMVGGQLRDLDSEGSGLTVSELERVHAAKTGALITVACRTGALAATADESALRAVEKYGKHLGLAFQITDDILDETVSTSELGKTAGKDRVVAKATFPAALGLETARSRARAEADAAVAALSEGAISSELLAPLAQFAIERTR